MKNTSLPIRRAGSSSFAPVPSDRLAKGMQKLSDIAHKTGFGLPKNSRISGGVVLPSQDMRHFKNAYLDNHAKITTIHDPNSDICALTLRINAGFFQDSPSFPGAVHLLEHVVFISSKHYPTINLLDKIVGRFGGTLNAHTTDTYTIFEIKITDQSRGRDRVEQMPKLQYLLKVFGSLIMDPAFHNKLSIDEIQAVHNEYAEDSNNIDYRIEAVLKEFINSAHPAHLSFQGNNKSLVDQRNRTILEQLKRFHEKYYTPEAMHLTVAGPQSNLTLENWANNSFRKSPGHHSRAASSSKKYTPLLSSSTPQLIYIKSVNDIKQLSLWFEMPDSHSFQNSKPLWIIENILTDERKGSLFDILKSQHFIDGIDTKSLFEDETSSLFGIQFELTSKGVRHYESILNIAFGYLHEMRHRMSESYIVDKYAEIQKKQDFLWKHEAVYDNLSLAISVATNGFFATDEKLVLTDFEIKQDIEATQYMLSRLRPEQSLMALVSDHPKTNRRTPWFKVDYASHELSSSDIKRIKNANMVKGVSFPGLNPYYESDIANIKTSPDTRVRLKSSSNGITIWYFPKHHSNSLRANIKISLHNPLQLQKIEDHTSLLLLKSILQNYFHDVIFLSGEALKTITFYKKRTGLEFHFDGIGMSDISFGTLRDILKEMGSLKITEQQFEHSKNKTIGALEHLMAENKSGVVARVSSDFMVSGSSSIFEMFDELKHITFNSFKGFYSAFFRNVDVSTLVSGNVSQDMLPDIHSMIKKYIHTQDQSHQMRQSKPVNFDRQYILPLQFPSYLNAGLNINNYHYTIQSHVYNDNADQRHNNAIFSLICKIAENHCYTKMRTEQQLGYRVGVQVNNNAGVYALSFFVDSNTHEVPYIHAVMNDYKKDLLHYLKTLRKEEFEDFRGAAIASLNFSTKTSDEIADKKWEDVIGSRFYHQDINETLKVIESLKVLHLRSVVAVYQQQILDDPHSLLTFYDQRNSTWRPRDFSRLTQ